MKKYTIIKLIITSSFITSLYPMEIDIHEACKAAKKGDLTTVKKYLDNGGNINAQDQRDYAITGKPRGLTLLHNAVKYPSLVQFLLKREALPDIKSNKIGNTPLHVAAAKGCLESARLLLEKGANINAKTRSGRTALYEVSGESKFDMMKFLLRKGIHIDPHDETTKFTVSHILNPPLKHGDEHLESMLSVLVLLKVHTAAINEEFLNSALQYYPGILKQYADNEQRVIQNIASGGAEYLQRIPTSEHSLFAHTAKKRWEKFHKRDSIAAAKQLAKIRGHALPENLQKQQANKYLEELFTHKPYFAEES